MRRGRRDGDGGGWEMAGGWLEVGGIGFIYSLFSSQRAPAGMC